jgi:ABC-type branched-subunit amino acid transport system substrate-binding protein
VKTEQYDNQGAAVVPQVNSLAATHADAFLLAAALLACPAALNAAGDAGWHPITYMSGTCVSKILFGAAGANAEGVLSVTPLLDPADPNNASNPAMQLYKTQFAKSFPPGDKLNDPQDGIVAYGWTTAALLVKTLELSPKLDRGSVMETARTLKDVSGVGLEIPAAKWNTSANDWFIGETFQFIKYVAAAKHTVPVGTLTNEDGKTASLTPAELINQ